MDSGAQFCWGRAYVVRWVLVAGKCSDEDLAAGSRVAATTESSSRSRAGGEDEANGRGEEKGSKRKRRRAIPPWLLGRSLSLSLSLSFSFAACTCMTTLVMGLMLKWAFKARDGHGIRQQHGLLSCSRLAFPRPRTGGAVPVRGLFNLCLVLNTDPSSLAARRRKLQMKSL